MTTARRHGWALAALVGAAVLGLLPVAAVLTGVLDAGAWEALASPVLWSRLGRSLGIGAAVVAICVPVGLLLAWCLTRTNVRGGPFLLLAAAVPLFLPPLVHALSWFELLDLSGVPAILAVYVVSYAPFVVLLAARSLQQVGRAHAETLELIGGRSAVFRDDLRQALPAALVGGGLGFVLLLSDFAVADFLTSVGPKVTVYADSLYALHQRGETGGAAAAALPGLLVTVVALAWVLRARRRLGTAVDARFEPATKVALGPLRIPVTLVCWATVGVGSVLPALVLAARTGAWSTFAAQVENAAPVIGRTLAIGVLSATLMVLLGLPLAWWASERRRPWIADTALLLPLAVPALLFGIGLVRVWNRPAFDLVYLGLPVVVMATAGRYLALAYLPLGGALERIGRGLLESAELAGAGRLEQLRTVLLPLLRTPLAGAWCVAFCFSLRELDTLVMLRAGHDTLLFLVHRNVVFSREDELAALALVTLLVTCAPLFLWAVCTRRPLRLV